MDKILIITGAGASHDSVNDKEVDSDINYKPPLTKDIFRPPYPFTTLESMCIYDILRRHRIASDVGYGYKKGKFKNEEALEKYLYSVKSDKHPSINKRFWAVPLYLYELFQQVSTRYIPTATRKPVSTNYQLLIDSFIQHNCKEIIWLNLNYDLLADYAIEARVTKDLSNLGNYTRLKTEEGMIIRYTKPHGSIDWVMTLDYTNSDYNIRHDLIRTSIKAILPDFEKRLSGLYKQREWGENVKENDKLIWYPAITAPLGKYKFICQQHMNHIRGKLQGVTALLCIGFSALDEDILDFIREYMPVVEKIMFVNENKEYARDAYVKLSRHYDKKGRKIGVPKDKATFNSGFTNFMTEGISEWLSS